MAEVIVSVVLEQLASIFSKQTEAKVRLVAGVEEEVQSLTNNFRTIQAVLVDAENRQVKDEAVKIWLEKLEQTSYDIDDVLDEWNTEIQKLQMKKLEIASEFDHRKVQFLTPSCCFSPYWQVPMRHDIATKIKNLNKLLDDIDNEKARYNFSLKDGTGELVRPITSSFSCEPKIYGRDEDMNRIINLLLSESSQGPTLPIISVVGMGGLGKTTLARLVYNNKEVNAHFNVKIWVCVSHPFDELKIALAILESLEGDGSNLKELDNVLKRIDQFIEGKRFLLVLDDVWIENPENWYPLMGSLKSASQGSRILVTTRKENTAKVIGTTSTISPGTLSDQDCWSWFGEVAFAGRTKEERKNLENIGRKIIRKCNGLPLAVKTLGSLLRMKTKKEQWQSVLDHEFWKLEDLEHKLFPPLLLSYYDLPSKLRKCFSYCALFPKDHKINKDKLIKLWMAQGYLKVKSREDMELIGEDYFENLAMRSFFQDFERKYDGSIISCKMHDIMHDFAQFLTNNKCLAIDIDHLERSQLESVCLFKRAQHLMVIYSSSTVPISIYNECKLRSLLWNSVRPYIRNDVQSHLSTLFKQLTSLRALDLSSMFGIQNIPKDIGSLMHLRYLDLSYNERLIELPETLCDLYNLQILDLTKCEELKKLPERMGNLINLKHLLIDDTRSLYYMPRGMERLTRLRTLCKLFVSGGNHRNKAYSLELLKDLNNHKESFKLEGLGNISEIEAAEVLKCMKNLYDLDLSFDIDLTSLSAKEKQMRGMIEESEGVLEALEPPPNLEKLRIANYNGKTIFPRWMLSLTNLQNLALVCCGNCEYLPPLAKLPFLETLRIVDMGSVKKVGNEFLGLESCGNGTGTSIGVFPKLNLLLFHEMEEWEEWDITIEDEDITIMPSLCTLDIKYCHKLKVLPNQILRRPTLQVLEINSCPILEECYKEETGESWPKISHIPDILISWEDVQRRR